MVLFKHFEGIWGKKWSQYIDPSSLEIALNLWAENLAHLSGELVFATLKKCASTLEWPPSIAEFIKIAGEHIGLPTAREALQLAIRRDSSPLAVKVFREIGSWDLSHGLEVDLIARVEAIIKEFRITQIKGIDYEPPTLTRD